MSGEYSIVNARASVMVYDEPTKKWIPAGKSEGASKIHIYHDPSKQSFRVVGRKLSDHEVVCNCSILRGLRYNQATATFHQWRDQTHIYGLNFVTKQEADAFAQAMLGALESLNDVYARPVNTTQGSISRQNAAQYQTQVSNISAHGMTNGTRVVSGYANQTSQMQAYQNDQREPALGGGYNSIAVEEEYENINVIGQPHLGYSQQTTISSTSVSSASTTASNIPSTGPGAGPTTAAAPVGHIPPAPPPPLSSAPAQKAPSGGVPPAPAPPAGGIPPAPQVPSSGGVPPAPPAPPGGVTTVVTQSGTGGVPPSAPHQAPPPAPAPPPSLNTGGGLAAALQSAKLKKVTRETPEPQSINLSKTGAPQAAGSAPDVVVTKTAATHGDVMSEMQRRLAARKARVDGGAPSSGPIKENSQPIATELRRTTTDSSCASSVGSSDPSTRADDSQSLASSVSQAVVSVGVANTSSQLATGSAENKPGLSLEMQQLKLEIMAEVRAELDKVKLEIIQAMQRNSVR